VRKEGATMKNTASFEPKMLRPEQESLPKTDERPWVRQRNEPALWYMRFQRYLDMGPKRSLRAVVVAEPDTQKATKGSPKQVETKKKLSDVSVPGAWKRASKVWHWVERAEAYDLDQMKIQAAGIRQVASHAPHASKAYRVLKLDYLARILQEWIKPGTMVGSDERKDFLAIIARYQSILRDMRDEMEGLGVTMDSVDAAAFDTVLKAVKQQELEEKLKNASIHERNKALFERYDQEDDSIASPL